MGLSLLDLAALARQGYKPADVKELLALGNQTEEEEQKETEPATETPEQTEPEAETVDFEALYNEQKTKLEEMSATVRELQSQLSHQNVNNSDNKSEVESLNDIAQLFYN